MSRIPQKSASRTDVRGQIVRSQISSSALILGLKAELSTVIIRRIRLMASGAWFVWIKHVAGWACDGTAVASRRFCMKLSIVIISWNDLKVLPACLKSIYEQTKETEFEIIISDNGSADGSLDFVRQNYPAARIVENRANLGYARGNNAGIAAVGEADYILILNPDTIIHDAALDKWVKFADAHPQAGAFGCRVLNPDGSYQDPARPFPTNWLYFLVALRIRQNDYGRFKGEVEREIDWQSGC